MKNLDNKIKTHGVRKKNKSKNLTELCLEELKIKGYTKIKSRLSKKDIISIRNQIDKIYKIQEQELGGQKVLKSLFDEGGPIKDIISFLLLSLTIIISYFDSRPL